jgi:hypothetical protein
MVAMPVVATGLPAFRLLLRIVIVHRSHISALQPETFNEEKGMVTTALICEECNGNATEKLLEPGSL